MPDVVFIDGIFEEMGGLMRDVRTALTTTKRGKEILAHQTCMMLFERVESDLSDMRMWFTGKRPAMSDEVSKEIKDRRLNKKKERKTNG
jgi:hypothetical protein